MIERDETQTLGEPPTAEESRTAWRWIVAAAAAALALLVLVGCKLRNDGHTEYVMPEHGPSIRRTGPDKFGVVCYRSTDNSGALSCVRIDQPQPDKPKVRILT
jgi:anti-sigma-K factor RskA